jgi:hypothetical protein
MLQARPGRGSGERINVRFVTSDQLPVSEHPKGEMDVKFKAFVERITWYSLGIVAIDADVSYQRDSGLMLSAVDRLNMETRHP